MFALILMSAMAAGEARTQPHRIGRWLLQLWSRTASTIVVAGRGEQIDGHVPVLERWAGDSSITPHTTLSIPQLARFEPELERVIFRASSFQPPGVPHSDEVKAAERESPGLVTCRRMILFLASSSELVSPDAIIWIENGHAYGLLQSSRNDWSGSRQWFRLQPRPGGHVNLKAGDALPQGWKAMRGLD
jgi:hypothetical protein